MRIVTVGGDARIVYAAECFAAEGHAVSLLCPAIPSHLPTVGSLDGAELALLPMPLTRDGVTVTAPAPHGIRLKTLAGYGGIRFAGGGSSPHFASLSYYNYAADPFLIAANAELTALGTLAEWGALKGDAAVLVVGYGYVGAALARAAQGQGYRVFVAARRQEVREAAERDGFAALPINTVPRGGAPLFVCNSVPAPIHTADFFARLPKYSRYYELASPPGGICPETDSGEIPIHTLPGIPGKYAPREAGRIIHASVKRYLDARGFL